MLEFIKKDTRTITGKNIREILKTTDNDDIMSMNVQEVKSKLIFKDIPENEHWRVPLIKELTNIRQNVLQVTFDDGDTLSMDELSDKISFVTTT